MGDNRILNGRARLLSVLVAAVIALCGAFVATGVQALLPQSASQMAYASTWSDSMIKQIDALPAAAKMNMTQAKKAKSLRDEITAKNATDEELLAIGSARIQKVSDGADRYYELEEQAEKDRINAFKKAKVKNVKVTVKKGKTVVKWKKLKGADEYKVYASAKKNGKYKEVEWVVGNKGKVTISNKAAKLKKGKKYYFKVRAITYDDNENEYYSAFSKKVRSKKLK